MVKVLVTGGTGFIGSWMQRTKPVELSYVHYLNHHGYDQKWWWMKENWNLIVHLAPVSPEDVIECASRCKARLLYCSSGAVYERKTEYANNKRRWEQECLSSGVDVVIARPFTFYGRGLDQDKAISRFSHSARKGETIIVWCDGSTVRSYMSGEEMAKWMWAILLRGKTGEAYDVGSDKPVTMLQLAQTINRRYGNRSPILLEYQTQECPVYLPKDTAKTRRLLHEA